MPVTGFTRNPPVVLNGRNGLRRPLNGGSRIVFGLAVAVLAIVLVTGAVVDQTDGVSARTAELRAAETERNREVTRDLVRTAEQLRQDIAPIAAGMEGETSRDQLASWRETLVTAAGSLANRPSAGTEANLAATGLAGAVRAFQRSVDAREMALDSPRSQSQELEALAAELYEDALVAWSLAASQLDVAGIEAGLGHVHSFLPAHGLEGELTDDH
jgi:hypothetical protein